MKTRKRGARGRALDPKAVLKIALLAAAAVFIGWLCVRAATVELYARRNPPLAASLAPDDPRVSSGLAHLEFRSRQGAVGPVTSRRAIEALQQAPLAHDPFFFAALGRLTAGQSQAALPLVREARRRNPRSRTTRLIYLDQVLRTGAVAEAAIEIAALSRLVPEASRVLIPELAKYAVDTKTASALIEALRPDPNLRDAVLEQLASSQADPDIILKLAASGPRAPGSKGLPLWQGRMLASLVDKGQIGRARTLWSGLAGVDPAMLRDGVYDGAFAGAPGPPPFNWQFGQSAAGVAEPTRSPALQVEYYGRADAQLASQLLQLDAGRHILAFVASGNAPSTGGSVGWTLTCLRGKAPVASLPISQLSFAPKRYAIAFVIPANCPAQWLRLTGTPAEFPAAHSITLANLQIRKASAS